MAVTVTWAKRGMAFMLACAIFAATAFADGTLYIYRPPGSWFGQGEPPLVQVDGKTVGRLSRAETIKVRVKAGRHTVKASETMFYLPISPFGSKSVTVNVPNKATTYVRVLQYVQNEIPVMTWDLEVKVVSAGVAAAELKRK